MTTVELPARLTIENVAALRDVLLASLSSGELSVQLDGRGVGDVDGAGVQLLLSAAGEAGDRALRLGLLPSASLLATLRLLGVEARFAVEDAP